MLPATIEEFTGRIILAGLLLLAYVLFKDPTWPGPGGSAA